MLNIKFPETNLVGCKFTLRQSNDFGSGVYDQFDHLEEEFIKKRKEYVYCIPEYLKGQLAVGDVVVVHCQTGYQLAEVVTLNATSAIEDYRIAPVVCKVDLQQYVDAVVSKEKLKELGRKVRSEAKRLQSMVTYEAIAEKCPEFKELLNQYLTAGGTLE